MAIPQLGIRSTVAGVLTAGVVGFATAAFAMAPRHDVPVDEGGVPVATTVADGASPAVAAETAARPRTTSPSRSTTTAPPSPAPSMSTTASGCTQTRRHREVEAGLAQIGTYGPVVVDGVQSTTDCTAIRRFQRRYGIRPDTGQADATTAAVVARIAASLQPTEQAKCGAGPGVTACVDLSLQTVWVMRDGVLVFGPTVVRTGFRGYATPAGRYAVNKRAVKEWSDPYEVWLPYWQRFHRGMGFHTTTTYLHNAVLGSHGCVNLLPADATAMWTLLEIGTTVRVFGRRPGT